eukprot:14408838-Alexandrium_andersonii.AAC.1
MHLRLRSDTPWTSGLRSECRSDTDSADIDAARHPVNSPSLLSCSVRSGDGDDAGDGDADVVGDGDGDGDVGGGA